MSQILDRAIELLIDGRPVDWEALLEDAADPHERALIEELRGLAQLDSEEHNFGNLPADGTLGIAAPGAGSAGQRWAHLELQDEIGRGTSGTVYRAWDTRLARQVALKLLTDAGGANIEEARRLARVTHPNVVTVYGVDRVEGQLGLWMELLTGRTLDHVLRDQGAFSARETIAIAIEICGAVAAIHRAGLVHRDIKAQNVMREPGGRLVLMDMGASHDVSENDIGVTAMAGTPLYMAPELFDGAPATAASDVYAIGVLLYRLVTADFPIHAHTIGDVRRAHATAALRPLRETRPDLPAGFVQVVERSMAHDPGKRFRSVATLERALHDVDRRSSSLRTASRRRTVWTLAGMAAIAVVAWLAWTYRAPPTQSDTTTDAAATPISPEQYKVFSGYEELAFNKRLDDPKGAASAINGALSQIRSMMPGNHPIYALLYARLSESWRRDGNLQQAGSDALDGAANALLSVGEDHPSTAVLAMEMARNAQSAGDHRRVATELLRALEIRWRILGLSQIVQRHGPLLDAAAVERNSRNTSCAVDTDGDGLLDLVEAAAGLDPRSRDAGADDAFDDDKSFAGSAVSNRLALGLLAAPYLTWAHYGPYQPRYLAWQSSARFPMVERADSRSQPAAWMLAVPHSQGFFTQRLSRMHSIRAMEAGFSLLVRMQPLEGLTSVLVDTAPAGPRFDLMVRRITDRTLEVRLLSSVVPREGPAVIVDALVGGRWPLLELRYRPQWKSAALYVDGRRSSGGYTGHHQFQDPNEGGVSWGIAGDGDHDAKAATAFNLIWLEIFGDGA